MNLFWSEIELSFFAKLLHLMWGKKYNEEVLVNIKDMRERRSVSVQATQMHMYDDNASHMLTIS